MAIRKAPRPTHYAAAGRGLFFECYRRDLTAWLDSYQPAACRHGAPNPKRTSNLNRVTCMECWAMIRNLAGCHGGCRR